MSQHNHVESRVEEKNLDSIVHVFCEDYEAGAEGIAGRLALRTGSQRVFFQLFQEVVVVTFVGRHCPDVFVKRPQWEKNGSSERLF